MLRVKTLTKQILNKCGYGVRKMGPCPLRQTISQSYMLLSKLGFRPESVVDVGVAQGTFAL